ncbi:MAG TPA: hypothetical protein VGM84_18125 [Steroidobacteraceae bacterium]|jgi:hypothetical protein
MTTLDEFCEQRGDPVFKRTRGVNWDSTTVVGPCATVGDCLIADRETRILIWLDNALPPRDGDVCLFSLKDATDAKIGLMKWFLVVDGQEFAACKYFALPADALKRIGVQVAELRWQQPWQAVNDPKESANARRRMIAMRMARPVREDMIIFPTDMTTPELCRSAIREWLVACGAATPV